MRVFIIGIAVLVAGLGWIGCGALQTPEQPPRPTLEDPRWAERELGQHLRLFNSSEVAGRGTGTQGFARAAAYVAARMRDFGVMPVFFDEFRVLYSTPLNHPQGAALATAGLDTLFLTPGVDFLPDARSDSGLVTLSRLVLDAEGAEGVPPGLGAAGEDSPSGVLLSPEQATTRRLRSLAAAGARAALVTGPLAPRPSAAPIAGLVVVQVTTETAADLLGLPVEEVRELLQGGGRAVLRMQEPVILRVRTEFQPAAGALNTMGYVAGRHPARAEELILVCSDLDANAPSMGISALDLSHLGIGTAALLELVRHYVLFARHGQVPERTILFAVWSGARLGHRGLRAFLQNPTWDLTRIRGVIYLGLSPEEEPFVRALLDEYGLPLRALSIEDAGSQGGTILLGEGPRSRSAPPRRRVSPLPPKPDLSDVFGRALRSAYRLAEAAHPVLLEATTTDAPFQPLEEDTLRLPLPPPPRPPSEDTLHTPPQALPEAGIPEVEN